MSLPSSSGPRREHPFSDDQAAGPGPGPLPVAPGSGPPTGGAAAADDDATADRRLILDFVILNKLGLHARPSARFVKISTRYKAEIWVEKDGEQVNGKSIMGLMMLAAGPGSRLRVTAEGPDAPAALRELETLVQNRFDEE